MKDRHPLPPAHPRVVGVVRCHKAPLLPHRRYAEVELQALPGEAADNRTTAVVLQRVSSHEQLKKQWDVLVSHRLTVARRFQTAPKEAAHDQGGTEEPS